MNHEPLTSERYGSNYTIIPARGRVPRARLAAVRAQAEARPRELRTLHYYEYYDDAVAIHRRRARPLDEHDMWEPVGVILFAPMPEQPDVLEIFALEIAEGCERGDVAHHIPLLFGTDDEGRQDDETREQVRGRGAGGSGGARRRPWSRWWVSRRRGHGDDGL